MEEFKIIMGALGFLIFTGFGVASGIFLAAKLFNPTKNVKVTYDNLDK